MVITAVPAEPLNLERKEIRRWKGWSQLRQVLSSLPSDSSCMCLRPSLKDIRDSPSDEYSSLISLRDILAQVLVLRGNDAAKKRQRARRSARASFPLCLSSSSYKPSPAGYVELTRRPPSSPPFQSSASTTQPPSPPSQLFLLPTQAERFFEGSRIDLVAAGEACRPRRWTGWRIWIWRRRGRGRACCEEFVGGMVSV